MIYNKVYQCIIARDDIQIVTVNAWPYAFIPNTVQPRLNENSHYVRCPVAYLC